jgi:leucyl-tRNA---protein transferase
MLSLIYETQQINKISAKNLDGLLAEGWRHFGKDFFRYNLTFQEENLVHVLPLRMVLENFTFSKSQQKILRKNADLKIVIQPLVLNEEKIKLFESHKSKFAEHPPEDIFSVVHLTNPAQIPCKCLEISVFDSDKLVACSFLDVGSKATSSIYGFYDLEEKARSLGIFTMLLEIKWAKAHHKQFYYSGYAYDKPSFYDYKKKFAALEYFDWQGNWLAFASAGF